MEVNSYYFDVDPLEKEATPGKGPIPCDLAIVGVAPSPTRPLSRQNEPFGTSSLKLLSRIHRFAEGEIYLTNLIKTPLPGNKKPRKKEVEQYLPLLLHELKLVKPKRILVMGTIVAKLLCPGFEELREDHGTLFWNPELEALVVPTFPFWQVGKDPSKLRYFQRDIWRFKNLPLPKPADFDFVDQIPEKMGDRVYLDLETTGLDRDKDQVTMMGLGNSSGKIWIIKNPTEQHFKDLQTVMLKSEHPELVAHNMAFDLDWFQKQMHSEISRKIKLVDTMLYAYVMGEEWLSLKHLSTLFTDRPGSRAFGGITDPAYLSEDIISTRLVHEHLIDIGAEDAFASRLLSRLVPHALKMKENGVFIDRPKLEKLIPEYQITLDQIREDLTETFGWEFNPKSTQEVAEALLRKGVKLIEKTETGKYTVKEAVLLSLSEKYPIVKELLHYREAVKEIEFLQSYFEKTTPEHPYLHPRLKFAHTATGRLSCENPNVQQVKRTGPIKTLYKSRFPGGMIGLIDLSAAELRIACLLSGDEDFAKALLSEDVHRAMASIAFELPPEEISAAQRKKSKGITFGLLYGGSTNGLAMRMGLEPRVVEEILNRLFKAYPMLMDFIETTKANGVRDGQVVSITGRVRDLRGLILTKGESDAQRKAINTPIQGPASDIALMVMEYVGSFIQEHNLRSTLIFGVHDSVLMDVYPTEIHLISQAVSEAFKNLKNSPLSTLPLWSKLPIVGEFILGESWAHVESTNENYDPDHNIITPCSSLDGVKGGLTSERDLISDDEDEDSEEEEE